VRTLVWFRGKDLRVADHAPLRDAMAKGEVIPLFVLDPYFFDKERARRLPHRMQFLVDSLDALEKNVAHLGSRLILVSGRSTEVVPRLAREWRVDRVVAHRWTEPFGQERDRRVQAALPCPLELFEGETLAAPGSVRTAVGGSFTVFTPFARAFRKSVLVGTPLPAPRELPPLPRNIRVASVPVPTCEELGLVRNERVLAGGERAGRARLDRFLRGAGGAYDVGRNQLDRDGTSRLSVDLKFGTLSARRVWTETGRGLAEHPAALRAFHDELLWREFAHQLLRERPELLREPFRKGFVGFPWRKDDDAFWAWQLGKTGYPVVDASARQLLGEGFVHNRARMISASFLTKHLLADFRLGEAHYLRYLTDGDWAQNDAGWQWSTGCGCDAQPYFRVFNPVTQGKTFDPSGDYVRRWVPELAAMPAAYIHAPWEAPAEVLRKAGVVLGKTYPRPIVEHAYARTRFLATAKGHLDAARESMAENSA
jgi:deoxyribodipyrimidine photo-lyase